MIIVTSLDEFKAGLLDLIPLARFFAGACKDQFSYSQNATLCFRVIYGAHEVKQSLEMKVLVTEVLSVLDRQKRLQLEMIEEEDVKGSLVRNNDMHI